MHFFFIQRFQAAAHRFFFHAGSLAEQNRSVALGIQIQAGKKLTFAGCQDGFARGQQGAHDFLNLLLVMHHVGPFYTGHAPSAYS